MALSTFNEEYQLRYQDVLTKELVAMKIATTELRPNLKYGDTVHRPKIDTSLMKVRDCSSLHRPHYPSNLRLRPDDGD